MLDPCSFESIIVAFARKEPWNHGNLRFRGTFLIAKKDAKLPIQMSNVIITVFSFQPVDSNDVLMMPPQRGRQLIFSSRAEHSHSLIHARCAFY